MEADGLTYWFSFDAGRKVGDPCGVLDFTARSNHYHGAAQPANKQTNAVPE